MPGVGARPPMAPGQPEMDNRPQRPIRQPPPSATLISQAPVVEFPTKEEAEKAFFKLLKETVILRIGAVAKRILLNCNV